MNQYIVIFLFLGLTFIWHACVPKHIRDEVVPWAFAAMMCNICCSGLFAGLLHGILGLLNYILFAILCDGFDAWHRNGNKSWKVFLVFWIYMIISSFWGDYKFAGLVYWANILLTTFCLGYSLAVWILRTPWGLRKLSIPMVLLSFLAVVLYIRHGGLSQVEVGANRAALDMESLDEDVVVNANSIATYMVLLLVFMLVAYMRTALSAKERLIKFCASIVAVPLVLILIRSGSRAGALCLFPMSIYFLFSTKNPVKRNTRIVLFVVLAAIIAVGVGYTMKNVGSVRAFSLKGDASYYETGGDQVTSGRLSMWSNNIEKMTTIQLMVGRGLWAYSKERKKADAGNAHSIYMTVLYNSGFVGLFLLLVTLIFVSMRFRRMGERGRMAGMLMSIWLLHGIGESWGMIGGGTAILAGIGFGLLSHCRIRNPEFMDQYGSMAPILFP